MKHTAISNSGHIMGVVVRLTTVVTLTLFCGSASAQHQPYAGLEQRPIKTLSLQQIADLNAGRGMGLALAAELNGYPGPIHAIELSKRLGLSADQLNKLEELFAAMKAETIPIGVSLIAQEHALNEDFANRTVTLASIDAFTRTIGSTQATLRAAHLKYHLSTLAVLTPEQVKQYGELRGYASTPQHDHQKHN